MGASVYDPNDPMGKLFFNILATFAEFEADLIKMRTREGMAVARAKGKLRGKSRSSRIGSRRNSVVCTTVATIRSVTWPSCFRSHDQQSTEPSAVRQAERW